MKKLWSVLCLSFLLYAGSVCAQTHFGTAENINDGWKFILEDPQDAALIGFDDKNWRTLDLPHDWSVEATASPELASCTGYLPGGIAWYRKTLDFPETAKQKRHYIYFEGVHSHSEVYLNGTLLGKRPNGYVAFMYDLTPHIRFGEKNVLAVRVDRSEYADSRWYTGSGIYRNVFLIEAGPIHVDLWGMSYQAEKITDEEALIAVRADILNTTDVEETVQVEFSIMDNNKTLASVSTSVNLPKSGKAMATETITLPSPQRWCIDTPKLYQLKTQVKKNGAVVDQNMLNIGLRTLEFCPNKGFALNGKWMKLKGVCIHHDAGVLGAAVPREVWHRRLTIMKNMGINAIRMSHNPQAPDVYDICDEIGLLVKDEAFDEWEFPKRKWLDGWNVGTPGFQGAAAFFEEWSDRDLRDIVLRGRHHPSIIMWSIGNEIDYPNDPYSHPILDGTEISQPMFGGFKPDSPHADRLGGIAKRLASIVRKTDPSRPVTAALAGIAMSNATEYPGALDVVGYNYSERHYAADRRNFPDRIIYGSENGHAFRNWKLVRDSEYVFGQFLWTGIDYLGESHRWPSRGLGTGLLDFTAMPKGRANFREALWSDKPVIHLGMQRAPNERGTAPSENALPTWNFADEQRIRILCYTNAARARLFINDQQVSIEQPYDDSTGVIYWDGPFERGKIEAVGYDEADNEICRQTIFTHGAAKSIVLEADKDRLKTNKDLVHVIARIVDDQGNPVYSANHRITCEVEGSARLLGVESGDNRDMSPYKGNSRNAYRGVVLAYVQTTGEPGKVQITVTAPGLESAHIELDVVP